MQIERGMKVTVDFQNESHYFRGKATVDRVEDGRVFGTMDDGRTFMCELHFITDVLNTQPVPIVAQVEGDSLHDAYQSWVKEQDFFQELIFTRGQSLFARDGDEYRYLPLRVGFAAYRDWCHATGGTHA